MNLRCPPQFLWLFQTCEKVCPNFYKSQNLNDSVNSLYNDYWDNPLSPSGKQLSNSDLYMQIVLFIFGIRDQDKFSNASPIKILHQNGYFIRHPSNIFELEFSIQNYLSVTECLMWAYVDNHLPQSEMALVLGNLRFNIGNDPEESVCRWINVITSKHSHLPPLNIIGKNFFGLPYFRIILYHFIMNDAFMDVADTRINNAKISFDFCMNNNIVLPFDINKVEQPPLCIICFLYNAIRILDKFKVAQKPPIITDSIVVKKLNGIQQLKNEVNQLTIRCNKLSDEVKLYSKIVKSRPHSVITKSRPVLATSILKKSQVITKPISHAEPVPRVSWDPKVIKNVGIIKSRINSENDPTNA